MTDESEKDAEISALRARIAQLEAWQEKGEALIESNYNGWLFHVGSWWADRPWRHREGLVPNVLTPPESEKDRVLRMFFESEAPMAGATEPHDESTVVIARFDNFGGRYEVKISGREFKEARERFKS